jgi:hypothetical protein
MRRGVVVTQSSALNVRQAPSTGAKVAGKLARGARVDILEQQGNWYRVTSDGIQGWAHSDFIRIEELAEISGFLRTNASLRRAALAPPAPLAAPAGAGPAERSLVSCWNSFGGLTGRLASMLEVGCGPAVSVLMVESGGQPFDADGRLIIRFENHVFWNLFGKNDPETFNRHFKFNAQERWKGHQFRANPGEPWAGFHGNNAKEWQVLEFAARLEESAAYRSASYGMAQVMGFNHSRLGYQSAREMVEAMQGDVRFHILGLFDFVKGAGTTSEMLEALRRRDYLKFATGYNGTGQAAEYAARIERFAAAWGNIQGAPA